MIFFHKYCFTAAVMAAVLFSGIGGASAAVLFFEDFNDDTLEPGAFLRLGTVAGGQANFDDQVTNEKANFSVVQDFTSSVMTFAFDVVSTLPGATNELAMRVGEGTANDMPSSSEDVAEHIFHRDNGNRNGFLNIGNESAFMVVNNQASVLNFNSPVDGSPIALSADSYLVFLRNNDDGSFLLTTGERANDLTNSPIERFAIGHTSNSRVGTFSLDNVRVYDEVFFDGTVIPEPSSAALLCLAMLALPAVRRRG